MIFYNDKNNGFLIIFDNVLNYFTSSQTLIYIDDHSIMLSNQISIIRLSKKSNCDRKIAN
jgi:hypothetical protein